MPKIVPFARQTTITELDIAYDIFYYNDQDRANSLNFAYSTDDSSYTAVSALDFTTPETADGVPSWQSTTKSIILTGLNIASGDDIYLQWQSADVSGGGFRDEFGIDNVSVYAGPCYASLGTTTQYGQ